MTMLAVTPAEVDRARVRVLSADHVFFDADGRSHVVGAGETVLELALAYTKINGTWALETRAIVQIGATIRQVWTIGKLVTWERA